MVGRRSCLGFSLLVSVVAITAAAHGGEDAWAGASVPSAHTTLVSVAYDGVRAGDGLSFFPACDAACHFVAFVSDASNLIEPDVTGQFAPSPPQGRVYLRDTLLGVTSLLSAPEGGATRPSVSGDGRFVTFLQLTHDERGQPQWLVRLHDARRNTTVWACPDALRWQYIYEGSHSHSFTAGLPPAPMASDDGRCVFFYHRWLDSNEYTVHQERVVCDVQANTSRVVAAPAPTTSSQWPWPSVSSDSNTTQPFCAQPLVRFTQITLCSNNTPEATCRVYRIDWAQNETLLVSQSSAGEMANGRSFGQAITSDGRFVVFRSGASNLIVDETPQAPTDRNVRMFLRDTLNETTSVVAPLLDASKEVPGRLFLGMSDNDARFILFEEYTLRDSGVYVFDRVVNATFPVVLWPRLLPSEFEYFFSQSRDGSAFVYCAPSLNAQIYKLRTSPCLWLVRVELQGAAVDDEDAVIAAVAAVVRESGVDERTVSLYAAHFAHTPGAATLTLCAATEQDALALQAELLRSDSAFLTACIHGVACAVDDVSVRTADAHSHRGGVLAWVPLSAALLWFVLGT